MALSRVIAEMEQLLGPVTVGAKRWGGGFILFFWAALASCVLFTVGYDDLGGCKGIEYTAHVQSKRTGGHSLPWHWERRDLI